MPEFVMNDFSAGWCPSDDAVGGRKNALLRMESVELDQNGALVMTGGTKKLTTAYAATVHSIYARFLTAQQYLYAADTSGNIFRANSNIGSGGSTTRCAFGSAFDFVIAMSGNKRIRDTGAATADLGQTATAAPVVALNGAGVLTGGYDYIQINVFTSGAYQGRSAPSPIASIVTTANKVQVTANNVSGTANEVWIFRRSNDGGDLDQYYRVKRLTSGYTTPFDDNTSDLDAIAGGITAHILAAPITSTGLPDAILEVVGPIYSRMVYFTANTMYCSEVNSPESYVPGQGVAFMGSATTSEIFLWARKIGNNIILIGTTHDIYRVTGTYVTLPDGTLDIYIRPLGVDAPPIGIDADIYNGTAAYMSAYGWVLCDQNGNIIPLCPPNTDRIYRGQTCYTMGGVPIYLLPQLRYACAVIRNKLYVRVPEIVNNNPANSFTYRMEVYDFIRKYWRVIKFPSDNAPLMLFGQEDDAVIGFFDNDKYIKQVDYQFAKVYDDNIGITKQTVNLLFTFQDLGLSFNRKDVYTLKLRVDTGGDSITYTLYKDLSGSSFTSNTFSSSGLNEILIPLNSQILKTLQISLSGQVADFRLTDMSLVFDPRPEQKTAHVLTRLDLDQIDGRKFRPRTWPILIDTLGQNITMTPVIDGSDGTTSTINTTGKRSHLHFFSTDVFCKDLGLRLDSGGGGLAFELYEVKAPEIVQILPIAKRFDQIGPEEFFRYGKIKAFRVRLLSTSTGNIPYTLYMQDASTVTGNIAATANIEDTYEILVPYATAGRIVRIELGATAFDFHRYYCELQVAKTGRDTEYEWVIIGAPEA